MKQQQMLPSFHRQCAVMRFNFNHRRLAIKVLAIFALLILCKKSGTRNRLIRLSTTHPYVRNVSAV